MSLSLQEVKDLVSRREKQLPQILAPAINKAIEEVDKDIVKAMNRDGKDVTVYLSDIVDDTSITSKQTDCIFSCLGGHYKTKGFSVKTGVDAGGHYSEDLGRGSYLVISGW